MALEKERLMAYFQEHYLSRQEVLYKLPLSLSIDAFWPELLNRRKATAAVLPLYNSAWSMPASGSARRQWRRRTALTPIGRR